MADAKKELAWTSPFDTADDMTDVVFVVEKKKLYFNRTVLSMCSPVFKAMFSSDFREKSAEEIPLPEKKYASMVTFFKHIHPMYSSEPVADDNLAEMLTLADEYQVGTVRTKCHQYIASQCQIQKTELPDDRLLIYLWMADQHNLTEPRNQLIELGVQRRLTDLKKSPNYSKVPPAARADLTEKVILKWERYAEKTLNPAIRKLSQVPEKLKEKACSPYGCEEWSSEACRYCICGKVRKIASDLKPTF